MFRNMCPPACMPCQMMLAVLTAVAIYGNCASKQGSDLQILDGVWGVDQPRRLPWRRADCLIVPRRALAAVGYRICIAAHLDSLCELDPDTVPD
jgi:hypothetical protein